MTSQSSLTDAPVQSLTTLLDVLPADAEGSFTGARKLGGRGRVFGGQVVGQGLMAASKTVPEDRLCHSIHCYFMRPASEEKEIDFIVENDMDGGTFSNRRVIARQGDKPIFSMTASFQRIEDGLQRQNDMPDVQGPDDLRSFRLFDKPENPSAIEVRPIGEWTKLAPMPGGPDSQCWFRVTGYDDGVPGGQAMQRAILAMMSDATLMGTAVRPYIGELGDKTLQVASIDHAVWIHGDVDCREWLLYATESSWAGGARGFARGQFFTADGRLVASVAQEGLMRLRDKA